MRATLDSGELIELPDCYIKPPSGGSIVMKILPDISDSKDASYTDEPAIGRSTPVKSYSYSGIRTISWTAYFLALTKEDLEGSDSILKQLRRLQSLVYPEDGTNAPYAPPPICKIKCGKILADDELCVILKNYNVKFGTDVVWDEKSYVPYKFQVDMSWEVVYDSGDLPGQKRIMDFGK